MANVLYAFGGEVVEITPDQTVAGVNVSGSNDRLRDARVTGDLAVPGSDTVLINNAFCRCPRGRELLGRSGRRHVVR